MGKAIPRTVAPSPPTALAFGRAETLLAVCWLLVPAVQYLITTQLTSARLRYEAPLLPYVWPIVAVYGDFTYLYLVLLAATVGVVMSRAWASRGPRP